MSEQELLTLEEAKPFCKTAKIHYATGWTDTFTWDALGLLKAQVAKLKAMGYQSPEEIKEMAITITVLPDDMVRWDGEKVAIALADIRSPQYETLKQECRDDWLRLAGQLKERLTGGE